MKDAKGFGGRSAGESGRLSDVARHVDPPMSNARPQPGAYAGFQPVEVHSDELENFTYQPTGAAPQIQVGPAERVAVASAPGSLPRGIRGSGDADRQIDEALLGLSMPARPRNTNPAETQSFAPARDSDFELEPRQPITLDDFDELINSELAAIRSNPSHAARHDDDYALGFDEAEAEAEGDYEPYDDYPVRSRSRLRGMMLMGGAAVVAIVAVAGVSTVLLGGHGGATSGDGSMLIKADAQPYKIAPVDPGGKTIPNQNKAVYQKVAGASAADEPKQQKLETAMEEPIDISEEDDAPSNSLPGVEVGDQIPLPGEEPVQKAEATKEKADDGTLQPRKVRTLSVRPDGTLVATEVTAKGTSLLTAATSMEAHAATLDPVAGIAPQLPFAADQPEMTTASTKSQAAPAAEESAAAPAPAAKPQRVAAVEEAPASADAYYVQIASQPSQEAAQDSLSNLGKRYSGVIGGRSLGIKPAEIPGKGTFYRVRVAAKSKSEANSLCESLKSAGGSCFVTR